MLPAMRDRLVWDVEDLDPDDLGRFGGKGTGLARMMRAGIPVPPGFVIGTDVFRAYQAGGADLPADACGELEDALRRLERKTGKRFGVTDDGGEPLLVSVRSGASVSMPGMMDTVLNLGLDAARAFAFARVMNDARFAIDTWIRFWRMFAEIVLTLDSDRLESDSLDARRAAEAAPSLETFDLLERSIVASLARAGFEADTSPQSQLRLAIAAVFRSWNSRRAKAYRDNLGIPDDLGTAVTIQAMVFGNRDAESGSGVAFSCNPNTGERGLYGEYVAGRQGEDLVSGMTTPVDLSEPGALREPLRAALHEHGRVLETVYRDAVDIEFTVESGRLYLLQVRTAKRTAEAAVRIAAELLEAGAISAREAVGRVTPEQLGKLLRPTFDSAALQRARLLTRGIGSSPGHAAGVAVLDADDAAERVAGGERVILLRPTTSPQDIRGMLVAAGIVTARGGALSHAAVVSRALDKPCIVGCESLDVDVARRSFRVGGETFAEGTPLSIDGETGCIYSADIPLQAASGGRAELARFIAAATRISGAQVAISAVDLSDVARASEAAGVDIIVGLTDLFIANGTIELLTSAIGALATRREESALEIERLASEAARRALAECRDAPVAFRLPSFLSERARQIVPAWAALPAQSLLPLGEKSFYAPIARGVAAAAGGRSGVSLLLSGATEFGEIDAFRRELAGVALPAVGAVLRSCAALQNFAVDARAEVDVWVDVDAVVRSAYGFPSELMSARGAFEAYREASFIAMDPQTTFAPFLLTLFEALLRRVGSERAGALCGAMAEDTLATQLYALGYRRFAVPASAREPVCLRLARAAVAAA